MLTIKAAIGFVRHHGIVLEGARGPVPNLAEAVAGGPIAGSWWTHPKRQTIFRVTRGIRESPDVLVCRLVHGKITYVHRRLWPALVRLARSLARTNLAALAEVHTEHGRHELRLVPFPEWVPAEVKRKAKSMTEPEAWEALGEWGRRQRAQPKRRPGWVSPLRGVANSGREGSSRKG
jgi:hypothetical protein